MKEINNESKKIPPFEKPIFVIIMTFTGGYMNGYTYITRNQILANMHTANMSKLGINIALRNYQEALSYFLPIAACILGSAFSELTKTIAVKFNFPGDWRKYALILEATSLFLVGLIPLNFIDVVVTNLVSFLMGYQLCLFRKCIGIAFNTTICTGNIRTVGQLLFDVLDTESKESIKKFITFLILLLSFMNFIAASN